MEIKEITAEMYAELKKELPKEAVKQHPTKTYLSSIKAIYVTERLNDVFGCGKWQIKAEKVSENDKGMVVIKTTLTIPEYGVYYESYGGNDNGGENSKNFDLGDAYKGATTDGITKIGSYLGIGLSVFQGKGNVTPPPAQKPTDYTEYKKKLSEFTNIDNLKVYFKTLSPIAQKELVDYATERGNEILKEQQKINNNE